MQTAISKISEKDNIMEKKFRILEGHKKDMWFVQEKSLINKRFEIVSIHYNQADAENMMTYKKSIPS